MCGRYTRFTTWKDYHAALRAFLEGMGRSWTAPAEDVKPRYNMAPTQTGPIVVRQGDGLEGVLARWDFTPFFFKQPLETKTWSSFNAKVEEIASKPAFRAAVKQRRCLVPNNGFIEWAREGARKTPYWIQATDADVSFFAGVWDDWEGVAKGAPVAFKSFAILTCAPNSLVAPIHNRMPVVLRPEDYETWLFAERDAALKVAGPYPAQMMKATRIGPAIGQVKNDYPELLDAA